VLPRADVVHVLDPVHARAPSVMERSTNRQVESSRALALLQVTSICTDKSRRGSAEIATAGHIRPRDHPTTPLQVFADLTTMPLEPYRVEACLFPYLFPRGAGVYVPACGAKNRTVRACVYIMNHLSII
jgi:hypothetical protein